MIVTFPNKISFSDEKVGTMTKYVLKLYSNIITNKAVKIASN